MTHSPAFWIAFGIAIFMIIDAWRTFQYLDFGLYDLDRKQTKAKIALTTLSAIALLFVVALVEFWSR